MAPPSDVEVLKAYPYSVIDYDNVEFFRGMLEKKLMVNQCDDCGHRNQPPWPICPKCWSTSVTAREVSGNGTVHTLIALRQGPPIPGVDYAQGYPVAVVELDEQEGLRASAPLVGAALEDLHIGQRVTLTWLERDGVPVPAFQPA